MKEIKVYNINGEEKETVKIEDNNFEKKINKDLIYYSVVRYLNNKRRGTASTKTRAEVSGGGRKPWKQKGTGRARQGSIRAVQWRHGGIAFGPKPRDYSFNIPKKVKRLSLVNAISYQIQNNNIVLLDEFKLQENKTKSFSKAIDTLNLSKNKILIIYNGENNEFVKAGRNIKNTKFINVASLNAYDILNSDKLLTTKDIFNKICMITV